MLLRRPDGQRTPPQAGLAGGHVLTRGPQPPAQAGQVILDDESVSGEDRGDSGRGDGGAGRIDHPAQHPVSLGSGEGGGGPGREVDEG